MSEQDRLDLRAADYKQWLKALKTRVRQVQLNAAVAVNQELLSCYWELGADIVDKQKNAAWGSGFLEQLSKDLRAEFLEMKGFFLRNIKYIRQWYQFYSALALQGQQPVAQFAQQPASRITQIPWGHNLVIVSKCNSTDKALYYVRSTIIHGWSRSVLPHQIESCLWLREGKAPSNFNKVLCASATVGCVQQRAVMGGLSA